VVYLKVLLYEHACGGGFAESAVSPGILAEGFGMLRSCVVGFKAAGCEVVVVLAEELLRFNLLFEADCVVPVFSFSDAQQVILKACGEVDAVYVIAPETGGTLYALVKLVEQNGVSTFNSHSSVIGEISNKVNLYKKLKVNKIRTPKTLHVNCDAQNIRQSIVDVFSFPVIIKPVDGVGCGGLSFVENVLQVEDAVEKIAAEFDSENFIVQEYLKGDAISVSLLCTGTKILPISLNKQNVVLSAPKGVSCYVGGMVPFEHGKKQEAFQTAEAVVNCFSGLRGYVGVDLILTDVGSIVVDVNPRLTTSFIGLNRVAGFNFVDAIINATLNDILPSKPGFSGYACFSKVETPKFDVDFLDLLYSIPEIVSPPFPVYDSDVGCTLLSAEGNSLEQACYLLEEAKKYVLNIM